MSSPAKNVLPSSTSTVSTSGFDRVPRVAPKLDGAVPPVRPHPPCILHSTAASAAKWFRRATIPPPPHTRVAHCVARSDRARHTSVRSCVIRVLVHRALAWSRVAVGAAKSARQCGARATWSVSAVVACATVSSSADVIAAAPSATRVPVSRVLSPTKTVASAASTSAPCRVSSGCVSRARRAPTRVPSPVTPHCAAATANANCCATRARVARAVPTHSQ